MLDNKVFVDPRSLIPEGTQVIFVSDLFVEDYVGGAELTSEALIEVSPFKLHKLHSKNVNLATLQQGVGCYWIFGNFSQINPELIPSIIANLKYSILEYDYKYCRYRSPEKHQADTGTPCDCHNQLNGKLISAFYYAANSLWWMSEKQKETYLNLFPFLREKDNVVLSSVFSKNTLSKLQTLREQIKQSAHEKKGWIVLGSNSWVKGFEAAKRWCEENNKEYEVVWNLPYEEVLAKMAVSEGFVYLPAGADTCPRMVIEAKLLGCKLKLNDFVQHKDEEWFSNNNLEEIKNYLWTSPELFWKGIKTIMDYTPTISGYITTYNCELQGYPFSQSIQSMLEFCEEVCVVDGGSTDATPETLFDIQMKNSPEDARVKLIEDLKNEKGETLPISVLHEAMNSVSRVKVKTVSRDWNHPRHAVYDGMQKAEARKMCTGDFCWQMDSDEIVHENDFEKVKYICKQIPNNVDVLALPVIEYWGGTEKVRADIQPWKWRISRNKSYITHGIPAQHRKFDENGQLFASEGTDGCDMIHNETFERIQHITFHSNETENLRRQAVTGNQEALSKYEAWFNAAVDSLPGVHHYSWFDISRKMKLYRDYWTRHWNSLYNKSLEDTAESNMMFDLPWSKVTDQMIDQRASELKEKTGGWIWHQKWTGQSIPHITCKKSQPKAMIE